MSNSTSSNFSAGTIRLLQDIRSLLDDRRGSDVQFKVGGGIIDPNEVSIGETTIDPSAAMTIYAHSAILRCRSRHFATIFDNHKEWKERSNGVIHKPSMSPFIFQKTLEYIYTGEVQVKPDDLFDLLSAAEEMELEELSTECQANIITALKYSFDNEEDNIENQTNGHVKINPSAKQQRLPLSVAIRKLLIPTLSLTQNLNLSVFLQQIFTLAISHAGTIFSSLDTRAVFFEKVPIPIFQHILASDALDLYEYDVWELAFSLACHKTKISKSAVEAYFRFKSSIDYDEAEARPETTSEIKSIETSQALISEEQLKKLKANLTPLLPAIRFSLMEGDQYSRIVEILTFFLPTRRSIELQIFHAQSEKTRFLDLPRLNRRQEPIINTKRPEEDSYPLSDIISKVELWQQIKTWIFESDGIEGCRSTRDIKLNLLFRASEHEFSKSAFHKHCDNKGPTIAIIKSDDGHLFGGVNFGHWESSFPGSWSGTTSNFLFALVDGYHRTTAAKFLYQGKDSMIQASLNSSSYGPVFGPYPYDLAIVNKANTYQSRSNMPNAYHGVGASTTALAGMENFLITEYEVFSISKDE